MRTDAMKDFVKFAKETDGPWSNIVKGAIEDGMVFGSVLTTKIQEAGFTITYEKGKAGHWCRIMSPMEGHDDPVMVAQGFSDTETDALKHAVFGEVKAEVLAKATQPTT